MAKYSIQDMAKERLKKMHEGKAKHKGMPEHLKKYAPEDFGDEEEMEAGVEEKTPAEGKHMPMHHGKPGLGGEKPEGVAVMIGIGKPMLHGKHPMRPPHPMYAKHPGLGESIEDEEPVMGGKYGK